jgi:hypothetical protein
VVGALVFGDQADIFLEGGDLFLDGLGLTISLLRLKGFGW